jgi:hypothetical protein
MRHGLQMALIVAVMAGAFPALALDDPEIAFPGIGLGDVTRVPCDVHDAQTPGPFVGPDEALLWLCPGSLQAKIVRMRQRLMWRPFCVTHGSKVVCRLGAYEPPYGRSRPKARYRK